MYETSCFGPDASNFCIIYSRLEKDFTESLRLTPKRIFEYLYFSNTFCYEAHLEQLKTTEAAVA
jgi:hypothetical protein